MSRHLKTCILFYSFSALNELQYFFEEQGEGVITALDAANWAVYTSKSKKTGDKHKESSQIRLLSLYCEW